LSGIAIRSPVRRGAGRAVRKLEERIEAPTAFSSMAQQVDGGI